MSARAIMAAAALLLPASACRPETTATRNTQPDAEASAAIPPEDGAGEAEAPLVPTSGPAPGPASGPPPLPEFNREPPGKLVPGSGAGATDLTVWAPNMRFPMEAAPAYANSQVYGVGGHLGAPGGQCDPRNYSYPWRDNFCESRGYPNMFCGNGKGHQGQDIRPATCKKSEHWVVAAETGTITEIGKYTVFLTAKSGRLYRYLHMDMPKVRQMLRVGQEVQRGERIGLVSNDFGGTPTTIHLHLEIKAPVTRNGATVFTFVPPYTSLDLAYRRLLSVSPNAPR